MGDPYLDDFMHGYIRATAKLEYWRVRDWCDFEDLVQEGYYCFAKCRAKYIELPDNPGIGEKKWLMCLVKTTFQRHIRYTLAGKMRYGHEEPVSQLSGPEESYEDTWSRLLPPNPEEATLAHLLSTLPSELSQLMRILAGDTAEVLGIRRKKTALRWHGNRLRAEKLRRQRRETTNEYYCRLVGLDPARVNLVEQIKEHFST